MLSKVFNSNQNKLVICVYKDLPTIKNCCRAYYSLTLTSIFICLHSPPLSLVHLLTMSLTSTHISIVLCLTLFILLIIDLKKRFNRKIRKYLLVTFLLQSRKKNKVLSKVLDSSQNKLAICEHKDKFTMKNCYIAYYIDMCMYTCIILFSFTAIIKIIF